MTEINNIDDFKVEPVEAKSIEPNCGYDPSTRVSVIKTSTRYDECEQTYYSCEEHYNVYGEMIAKYEEKINVNDKRRTI
jgi:hypothetical protein